ncbi:AraC family transcriptional regulator [Paenibacillus nasutitermitis]|uniref:AraC family transcriptional regulator n=1 Tax=Paenibacillus nasutitermitis TaxID=1652958 RepID=A0A916YUF1_9BACL|nr:AraC family transcriptional regulator [Paenibacillus nasutitermitis]GGD60825.1 AraC family transcriptional regulator [Paenibacillus nasutitermitis]
MTQKLELTYRQQLDSNLEYYYSGSERCAPGHSYGPAVRQYYLIHYVRSGRGIFRVSGKEHSLRAGQIFLINPGDVTYYQADLTDPWHYSWIAFHGLEAATNLRQANLTAESPVMALAHVNFMSCFEMLEDAKKLSEGRELRLTGGVYIFLSSLLEAASGKYAQPLPKPRGQYVRAAIEFTEKNFSRHMTIEELASYIGLNRSYLCAIFKEETQLSPQQYLIRYRMERACELLENESLSIGDISRSVGYDDPLVFSKMFTKLKGMSPREYRKQSAAPIDEATKRINQNHNSSL